jgi:hypothetical protein
MGQGIIANADVEFFTEALLSCTFITGCDATRTRGGAFHFPAGEFATMRPVLDQWMGALNPGEITLVFAARGPLGMGTPESDRVLLQTWLARIYPGVTVTTTAATAAGMGLTDGRYQAGNVASSPLWNPESAENVTEAGNGQHALYRLFDARHLMTPSAPVVVQEATSGRVKRKRSWLRRHGCIVM